MTCNNGPFTNVPTMCEHTGIRVALGVVGALALLVSSSTVADDAASLGLLNTDVLTGQQRGESASMIDRDIRRRSAEVNARNRAEWARIKTREH